MLMYTIYNKVKLDFLENKVLGDYDGFISISEKYTANVLRYYGFPSGAVVLSVTDGSPASDAGIEKGDIITKFNGVEITEYPVLEKVIGELQPNDKVSVTIYRNGRYYTTKITIGSNNQIE